MSIKVIWSKDASDELIEIIVYAKEHNSVKNATDLYKRIKNKLQIAKTIPEGGRIVPELASIGINGIREVIENPWRIFYRIISNEFQIISIVDGRRDLESILYKKLIDGKLT